MDEGGARCADRRTDRGGTVMKKQIRKITLNRETLQALNTTDLGRLVGGAASLPPVCENSGNAINTCSARC
jgi:hypothetical protein